MVTVEDKRFIHIGKRVAPSNANPQVKVLGRGPADGFVKLPHLLNAAARHQDGRWGDAVTPEKLGITAPLEPLCSPDHINTFTRCVVQPACIGMDQAGIGMSRKAFPLTGKFIRKPDIVGVEKGEKLASRLFDAAVTCSGEPSIRLLDIADAGVIRFQARNCIIGGTVVYDDHLKRSIRLGKGTFDSLDDKAPTVVRRNDYTDEGVGRHGNDDSLIPGPLVCLVNHQSSLVETSIV
jgi:hypothetical protein